MCPYSTIIPATPLALHVINPVHYSDRNIEIVGLSLRLTFHVISDRTRLRSGDGRDAVAILHTPSLGGGTGSFGGDIGGLGVVPQRVQGQSPCSRGLGALPPEAESFLFHNFF